MTLPEKKKKKNQDSSASKTTKSEIPEGIPPEFLEMLDERIDGRIDGALERFKPEVAEAVRGAITQVMKEAQAAGVQIPTAGPGGGVVSGSDVTPAGAALINWMTGQGQQTDMEKMASFISQARMVSDAMNPPSAYDNLMRMFLSINMRANINQMIKSGVITKEDASPVRTALEKVDI